MSNDNSRSRAQEAIAGRGKAEAASAQATANIATFGDWLFYGTAPNIFLSVTVGPASAGITLEYILVVLQTPGGQILCDAAINTTTGGQGFNVNIATDCSLYSIQQYGTQVQGWAYAAYGGGYQYSAIQNYTVS